MAHEAIRKAKSMLVKNENVEKVKALFALKETTVEDDEVVDAVEEVDVEEFQPRFSESEVARRVNQKSKLIMCIEILCALVSNGPMKTSQMLDKFEIDPERLKANLRLLWDRGLIEEEQLDEEEPYYLVTPRGKTVLNVVSPILKEAHKLQMREYDYLSNTLEGAGFS